MTRTSTSTAARVSKLVSLIAVLALALGAAKASAAEVAPEQLILQLLSISQSSDGHSAFGCGISVSNTDGSFECGPNISGRIVGVTNEFGAVSGHRIRITRRVSSTVTENYTGAIDWDVDGYGLWMAGEYSVTSQVRRCVPNARCLTYNVTSGPLPFTGISVFISG